MYVFCERFIAKDRSPARTCDQNVGRQLNLVSVTENLSVAVIQMMEVFFFYFGWSCVSELCVYVCVSTKLTNIPFLSALVLD